MAVDGGGTDVRALVFDVFGTVVDWHGSIVEEGARLGAARGLAVDWARFANVWRGRYAGDGARAARRSALDPARRAALEETLAEFGIATLGEADKAAFNRVWHRLRPWPDSVAGLTRCGRGSRWRPSPTATSRCWSTWRSTAGCRGTASSRRGLTSPDPAVYRLAPELLDLPPERVMMVAAHGGDLRAARAVGLRTAFVTRPLEFGPDGRPERTPDPACDLVAADFLDLARQLGAYAVGGGPISW